MILCLGEFLKQDWSNVARDRICMPYRPACSADFGNLDVKSPPLDAAHVIVCLGTPSSAARACMGRALAPLPRHLRSWPVVLAPDLEATLAGIRPSVVMGHVVENRGWRFADPSDQAFDHTLKNATVVLVHTLLEPFGMAGFEAMMAGVPTLVRSDSGLAQLLTECLPNHLAEACVADVETDSWGMKLAAMLNDVQRAFRNAAAISVQLSRCQTEMDSGWLQTLLGAKRTRRLVWSYTAMRRICTRH
jgi:glycosyltransferase involved in cell wall biosynthesis